MLVIVVEKASPTLKGRLSCFLTEVNAGVFIGDFSIRVRDRLWALVVKDEPSNATMIWNTPHEAGFDFVKTGVYPRKCLDLDGLKLCQKIKTFR